MNKSLKTDRCLIFSALFLLAGIWHMAISIRDARYVHEMAAGIVSKAGAKTDEEKVVALRDYLRTHVDNIGLNRDGSGRPFLRESAAQTLRSNKGLCGEVSRAFIVMASELGIRAQRLNLFGEWPHVVAEAEVSPGVYRIVDSQEPPQIKDLEPLDKVILRPQYTDYYTLNVRRLHLNWLMPRIKLEMGPLTRWLERPHMIQAAFWFALALLVILLHLGRLALRALLHRRGWVHVSDQDGLRRAGLHPAGKMVK